MTDWIIDLKNQFFIDNKHINQLSKLSGRAAKARCLTSLSSNQVKENEGKEDTK